MGYLSTVPHSGNSSDPLHPDSISTTVYGSSYARDGFSRFEMAEEEMPARIAKRFVDDELLMDGTPALNLASFVTTYMEDEAEQLMVKNLSKNFIDVEEYPALGEIETRCVNIIARLFNAPLDKPEAEALGVSTVGSSEAIILSVLAAKRRWQEARKAAGKDASKPNIVMNAAVQVCWEKAARYLEVEERYWKCTNDKFIYDPKEMVDLVDENTVLVVAILGTTYTGQYEDVVTLNKYLEEKNAAEGLDVHIHVDGASGGFVVPFLEKEREAKGLKPIVWDFRVPLVCSINASGHKYGLSYPGVGWALWRNKSFLPDSILFTVNYLGSPQVSFTLNFSKSGVQVIGQYYAFLRYGKSGFTAIMSNLISTSDFLADAIERMGDGKKFVLLSDKNGDGLPLVAWRLAKEEHYDEFAIARQLRSRGWIVPAYTMAPDAEKLKLLRVVVREDFSRHRCETFIRDLRAVVQSLDETPAHIVKHMEDQAKRQNDIAASISHPDQETSAEDKHRNPHGKNKARHRHVHDEHSLQGKHGKTHAIC